MSGGFVNGQWVSASEASYTSQFGSYVGNSTTWTSPSEMQGIAQYGGYVDGKWMSPSEAQSIGFKPK